MDIGRLEHICVSSEKGVAKSERSEALVLTDFGIEGDAHAGKWHRQVSLLDAVDIESMKAKGLELAPGAFGENLVLAGVELGSLGIGSRLAVGEVVLEISQIGKVCHDRCAIYEQTGDCIMPRRGLFAVVIVGGSIRQGCEVRVVRASERLEQASMPGATADGDADRLPALRE